MDAPVVVLDWPEPHVARLRINRPAKRNAINYEVRQSLLMHLASLHRDASCRALVVGGVEGVFSAGGDLNAMVGLDAAAARRHMAHIHRLCHEVASLRVPMVSVFEGVTAGAAVGLALLGDEILMGRQARVLFPFLRLGLVPDWGQLLTLPRRVGGATARRWFCSSNPVDAQTALEAGLVDAVHDDTEVMAAAIRRAAELACLPAAAHACMKQVLQLPIEELEAGLMREAEQQVACLCSADFQEGLQAFQEKRQPNFLP